MPSNRIVRWLARSSNEAFSSMLRSIGDSVGYDMFTTRRLRSYCVGLAGHSESALNSSCTGGTQMVLVARNRTTTGCSHVDRYNVDDCRHSFAELPNEASSSFNTNAYVHVLASRLHLWPCNTVTNVTAAGGPRRLSSPTSYCFMGYMHISLVYTLSRRLPWRTESARPLLLHAHFSPSASCRSHLLRTYFNSPLLAAAWISSPLTSLISPGLATSPEIADEMTSTAVPTAVRFW